MGRIAGNKVTDTDDEKFGRLVSVSEDGCWNWTGGLYRNGYGRFAPRQFAQCRAHRYLWLRVVGEIPEGKELCHKCDNRRCVRPSHIFLGTRLDNMRDAAAKGRTMRGESHCYAKLTLSQVQEIRALRVSDGISYAALGRRYGVSRSATRDVCVGKTWAT